jgi:hypothetical protein
VTAEQLRQSINQLAPPDAQLASAALPQQASDEQIRSAIDSNTWYRWPGAKFAPQAVAPPVAVAQNASAGTQPPNPAAPAGAAAGTAAAKPAAPHKRAHHVAGAVDNVD